MAASVAHPTNLRWLHLQPAVDAIWAGLSEANGNWHCMNPTRELSIWEARDGSALLMAFADDEASTLRELVRASRRGKPLPAAHRAQVRATHSAAQQVGLAPV